MTIHQQLIDVREEYINLIKKELLGPGSEYNYPDADHELITTAPEKRYSIGVLFPQNNAINAENQDSMRIEANAAEYSDDNQDEEIIIAKEVSDKSHSYFHDSDINADENLDEEISLAAQNQPASMGIVFVARGDLNKIKGHVSFATYRRTMIPDCKVPYTITNYENYVLPQEVSSFMEYNKETSCIHLKTQIKRKQIVKLFEIDTIPENEYPILKNIAFRLSDQLQSGYVRVPHEVDFELNFDGKEYIDDNKQLDGTSAKITALKRKIGDNLWSITIMLVNESKEKPKGINCILQPKLIFSTNNNSFLFSEYQSSYIFSNLDEEEQSLALLYRTKKIYGSGLGTSASWDIDDSGHGIFYSNFFPQSEIPSMNFGLPQNDLVTENNLSMKYLSDLSCEDKSKKISNLNNLVKLYETWILGLNKAINGLPLQYRDIANKNVIECQKACNRMYSGIKTLETNELAWSAFALANRSMFIQREQIYLQGQTAQKDRYPEDDELSLLLENINYKTASDKHYWRPFQLAFLLMDINSIVNDDGPERNLVDLIWFPTGGGKTEAYLGLTAFTIFYRRLTHLKNSSGTAVIMRYTLRLLAAQQFTRAATLICACEFIRRDSIGRRPVYPSYPLGNDPITIGLWIGGEHTPNKNEKADIYVNKLLKSSAASVRNDKDKYNKFQVLKCPWCGTKLVKDSKDGKLVGRWGYKMKDSLHFYMSCQQESCHFNDILPVQIVDQELYNDPPSLLFGTVDKFAMLPWESAVGKFFAANSQNRTPELIIQDELHLISGPLGTIVGLYETVIDALCTSKGIRPKIIASTATIRRAKEQCSVLYNREVVQFPAPGLNASDSFFARESEINHQKGIFGRKYVGLMPSGKTKAMMEVRTIATLLQKAKIMDLPDKVKDKIWTLAVYFNSLKDLGKCNTLVDDDVKDFIIRMSIRLGSRRDARQIFGCDELTSRVSTTELNETLDKLEKSEYSQDNIINKRYASNILLATNMISVGIDVPRLNVMLLVGQPKLTSEYIQASSRVGREYPGTAFVMYDGSKSRDRSHFEQFKAYHESFYRFVEPTGATPFSKPARDRALHAVVTAMLRYRANLSQDKDAFLFDTEHFSKEIDELKLFICQRVKDINERTYTGMEDDSNEIMEEIDLFLNSWQRIVETAPQKSMFFGKKFMVKAPSKEERRLLKVFGSSEYDTSARDTLTSMRNVDSAVAGNILFWED
jgi:hypothetical protein